MSTLEFISLIAMLLVAGGVSSRVVILIQRSPWGSRPKWVLAVAFSGAFGLATAWLAGDVLGLVADWGALTGVDVFAFMSAVYMTANGFYVMYWKPRAAAAGKTLDSVADRG